MDQQRLDYMDHRYDPIWQLLFLEKSHVKTPNVFLVNEETSWRGWPNGFT